MSQPKQAVLVEYARPPEAEAESMARRLDRCLEMHGARWMRSYISLDGKHAICEFEGPDAESVREAFRMAGQPFDRAWLVQMWAREKSPR